MNPRGIKRFRQLRAVIKSVKRGTSFVKASAAAGIDASTLWLWRKDNPRLDALLHNIVNSRIQNVEDSLYAKAIEGHPTAIIFFLTNRNPESWKDRRALVNNTVVNTVIQKNRYENIPKDKKNEIIRSFISRASHLKN